MSDGVLELMLIKKMTRMSFIKLIGKYKDGTLIDKKTLKTSIPEYDDTVIYLRIKSMKISGMKQICSDGEIEDCQEAEISVVPAAINYRV